MKEITAPELKTMLEGVESITLIDVREPYEHEEFNILGLVIPLADIPYSAERIKELGDTTVVLYCRSGNRSTMAQKMLAMQHGITNTLNLKGGLLAWKEMLRNKE